MKIINPIDAKNDFYQLLKSVNNDHEPIYINSKNNNNDAVIIGKEDWKSIRETIYLEASGTMDIVRERENDNSGTTNINDIDWARLN